MKTVLNNLCIHVGYEHDGRLVHTDQKTGVQMVSIYTWPSLRGAREALANAFGKIEWEKLIGAALGGRLKLSRPLRGGLQTGKNG